MHDYCAMNERIRDTIYFVSLRRSGVIVCVAYSVTVFQGLVRLAGDNRVSNTGRLEVLHNSVWGTVCRDRFDNRDAQVACYMLGLGYTQSSPITSFCSTLQRRRNLGQRGLATAIGLLK